MYGHPSWNISEFGFWYCSTFRGYLIPYCTYLGMMESDDDACIYVQFCLQERQFYVIILHLCIRSTLWTMSWEWPQNKILIKLPKLTADPASARITPHLDIAGKANGSIFLSNSTRCCLRLPFSHIQKHVLSHSVIHWIFCPFFVLGWDTVFP